ATDLLFGRQFWAVRVFNAGCMAAVCGLVVWTLLGRGRPFAALLAPVLFVIVDVRTRLYGRAILTEALAALWVAVLCLLLVEAVKQLRTWKIALAGVVFGLAVLTRTLFILWLPGLLLLIFCMVAR